MAKLDIILLNYLTFMGRGLEIADSTTMAHLPLVEVCPMSKLRASVHVKLR